MNALKTYGVALAGAVLLVVGVIMLVSRQLVTDVAVSSVDATGPVPEPSTSDPTLGVFIALAGLVLLAGWVGFRIGRRGQAAQSRS